MTERSATGGVADFELIRFDRRTLAFLGLLVLVLVTATAFKIHGSSIGVWNEVLRDREPAAFVLLGKPRLIRGDEWGITTPAILSQAHVRPSFPLENPAWGAAQGPMILNLPIAHWSMLARPQFLGFFVLDLERAFAFYWGMKGFLVAAGVFLLLMLLTKNHFGVSVLGAAWVFFSGFMQWWYSTPAMLPETVGCVALLLVAAHYLLLSNRRWVIGASALLFSLCLVNSVLTFYPPFQVPMLHLGIAIAIGSLGPRLAAGLPREQRGLRVACAGSALVGVVALLTLYFAEAMPAIRLMLDTAYPGARVSSGGDVSLARVFSGFFGFFNSDSSHPAKWLNVCEASNFVLLFPVPMAAMLWRVWSRQSVTALEWSLAAYLLLVLTWMTVGLPRALAVVSGFGMSQGTRPLLGLGLGSILLCCVFLARQQVDVPRRLGIRLAIAAALFALLGAFAWEYDRVTEGFATSAQVALVILVSGAAGYLLLARRRILFAALVLVPEIWSHGLVNPVATGLAPILETRVFREVSRIVAQDPDARWTAYGGLMLPDLLKATGARVFNGTKIVPPLDDLRVIDPASDAEPAYNRYAFMKLDPAQGSGITVTLVHPDTYAIAIDPKSDLWRQLRIRYVALTFVPTDPEFLGITTPVLELPDLGLRIYEYHWGAGRSEH